MCAQPLGDVLHHYVVPWLQADWPVNWPLLVGRMAPLVVEIGFGNGLFFLRQAERNPEVNLIGIELSWRWVHHLAKRLDAAGLAHVRLIHGEAQVALQHLFSSNSICEIFINFPDPWPRKRHHSRRLIQPELVDLLHDRLAPSGQVTIATDHPDYATWIAAILERQTALRSRFSTTAVEELTGRLSDQIRTARAGGQPANLLLCLAQARGFAPNGIRAKRGNHATRDSRRPA